MHISIRVRCIFNFCYCQPFHHRCDKLEIVINRHLIIAASYFLRTSWELLLFSPSSEFLHCILRWYEERTWTEMTKVTRFTFWCTKKWSTINRGNYMNALNRRLIFMKCFLTNLCILSFAQHDKKKTDDEFKFFISSKVSHGMWNDFAVLFWLTFIGSPSLKMLSDSESKNVPSPRKINCFAKNWA